MSFTTENVYDGNGTTTLFSFTFPYIDEADVKVSLNSLDTTAFTLANATTVEFDVAPSLGVTIRIYRSTPIDVASSVFFPGSAIRAQDLNSNFEQSLYVAQETQDVIKNSDAGSVVGIATEALNTANEAKTTADAVDGKATTALNTANAADVKSDQAVADAATAQSTALDAQVAASVAQSTADGAKTIAENALDPTSVLADLADVDATTPAIDQALIWTGTDWKPGDIDTGPQNGGTGTDAWAAVDLTTSNGPCNVPASFNVASVTKRNTGVSTVTFITPMANNDYAVVGTVCSNGGASHNLTIREKNPDNFIVVTESGYDYSKTNDRYSVVVYSSGS